MDFALTEEQQGFVDTAKAFAQDQLAPHAAEWDANNHFAKDALHQAGALGFMGMYTPEHAGGLAMPRLDASLIVEELAKGCTTTAAFLTIHNMATNMIGRKQTGQWRRSGRHLLRHGQTFRHRCRLQGLQRRLTTAGWLRLSPRIPHGALCA